MTSTTTSASSPSPNGDDDDIPPFERKMHVRYFLYCLRSLPGAYSALDTNRLTLVHFAVHSLDLLGVLDDNGNDDDDLDNDHKDESTSTGMNLNLNTVGLDKQTIIDWIYSLLSQDASGFKGGTYLGGSSTYDHSHIAMTYTALCTLTALGDNLSKIKSSNLRTKIIQHLSNLQRCTCATSDSSDNNTDDGVRATKSRRYNDNDPIHSKNYESLMEGAFHCLTPDIGSEHDMRFLYCACCISYMLNDWSGINKPKALQYIQMCHSYDGAFALLPGQEGHGGSTFCAVASLYLMNELDSILVEQNDWKKDLIQWCVNRQLPKSASSSNNGNYDGNGGMQGRPNKVEDTCYSYWIGGTLQILNAVNLIDTSQLTNYVLRNQTDFGGFSKVLEGSNPDILHSFYSMSWLSLDLQKNDNHNHGTYLTSNGTNTNGITYEPQQHEHEIQQHEHEHEHEVGNGHLPHKTTIFNTENNPMKELRQNSNHTKSQNSINITNNNNPRKERSYYFLHELDCVLGIRKSRADHIKQCFR